MEYWKELDTENGRIFVSNEGNLISIKKGLIKGTILASGYRQTFINKKCVLFHRIIAKAFIDNPENKPCVNHIDFNKLNNKIENLEWCSYAHNSQHTIKHNRHNPAKGDRARWFGAYGLNNPYHRVVQCLFTGRRLGTHEAARELGIATSNLCKMLSGKRNNWTYFIYY